MKKAPICSAFASCLDQGMRDDEKSLLQSLQKGLATSPRGRHVPSQRTEGLLPAQGCDCPCRGWGPHDETRCPSACSVHAQATGHLTAPTQGRVTSPYPSVSTQPNFLDADPSAGAPQLHARDPKSPWVRVDTETGPPARGLLLGSEREERASSRDCRQGSPPRPAAVCTLWSASWPSRAPALTQAWLAVH